MRRLQLVIMKTGYIGPPGPLLIIRFHEHILAPIISTSASAYVEWQIILEILIVETLHYFGKISI